MNMYRLIILLALMVGCLVVPSPTFGDEPETLWLEAEHFTGIVGHCWPLGDDSRQMRITNGHWGLSGPGWAAEWNQGGESGFLSIAAGPSEAAAEVTREVDIPVDGDFQLWVRYADWREASEEFEIHIEQPDQVASILTFGQIARCEEDNEMKLYFDWAFAWDHRPVQLKAGWATIRVKATKASTVPRQIDVLVLTNDSKYQPFIKERPRSSANAVLEKFRGSGFGNVAPLARRNLVGPLAADLIGTATPSHSDAWARWTPPAAWRPKSFRNEGFLYLWNLSHTDPLSTWLSDRPDRVKFPYNIIDAETRAEFEATYGGRDDVPIFSDPRIAPIFHGVGGGVFATDPATSEVMPLGKAFARWLDENPSRAWGMMMNYHPGTKIGPAGVEMFSKYRDRFVGSIAGESLGYFYPDSNEMAQATASATTRRELVSAFTPISLAANAAKYQAVYDRQLDENPYADVISCHSVGSLAFIPICFTWGARTVGYESSAATSTMLGLRWAALRGAARQFGGMTATYRSCNFGDSSTIFSRTSSFSGPENIFDNYYSVFSGAGMTWYKFDIWYQYMSGSSMFYHEQGFDEFWKPGGTTAAGRKPVQLSPKGKLVDRFLRTTRNDTDRGSPVTPIAFLMDYAHGWEPATFWPNSFVNWHQQPSRFLYSDHEQMLEQWLRAAWFPIGPQSERPITGVNEVFVAGLFGDIFDCFFAVPDTKHWQAIDHYPVVIAVGELELTADEARRLNAYVEQGGTLLVSSAQVSAETAKVLNLPQASPRQRAKAFRWTDEDPKNPPQPSPVFEFEPIDVKASAAEDRGHWVSLARSVNGETFCAFADRGQGRLVYLSIPKGLTVSRDLHPIVPQLFARLRHQQMPIEVVGDVEWMVNRGDGCWLVTLINPYGQDKPQQGITPTDYRENRTVLIDTKVPLTRITDWLAPHDEITCIDSKVVLTVPAGGVRILELR